MATFSTTRGMKAGGLDLWEKVTSDYDLRPDELALLRQACLTVDTINAAEKEHARLGNPLITTGSMGQTIVHPLLGELRAQRSQLTKLLTSIGIPDEAGGTSSGTDASTAGANLVQLRWGKRGA